MQFLVFPGQRLVLIDELTDLGEQCGRCSIASCGQLGFGSAAPFGGSRGHRLVPSATKRRAPAANSLLTDKPSIRWSQLVVSRVEMEISFKASRSIASLGA